MRVGNLLRKIGPFVALAAAAGLAGCDGVNVNFNGEEGVPLSELDLSGDPPTSVALGGPDAVVITTGDEFTIDVDGSSEATERLRFVLEDGTLAVGRENGSWSDNDIATVLVTLPSVSTLALGGSGSMTSDTITGDGDIVIGGSGTVTVTNVATDSLSVVIGGSGSAEISGATDTLDVNIGGSGSADMAGLQAGSAEVGVFGSGSASFASDGEVEATIAGSGTVRVTGSATCTVDSYGSGEVICEEIVEEDA